MFVFVVVVVVQLCFVFFLGGGIDLNSPPPMTVCSLGAVALDVQL